MAETRELTAAEYDDFASYLLADREWLPSRTCLNVGQRRKVMAVNAPGRRTPIVDPSGYNYGRHMGFSVE
ncbi:hypothetical protein FNU76_19105 [Chitinimonas arctica]|uniref:Uncharacterized protein n=1 Tax=Chitinimonas arctica TaxID=2594795 RepID=A0A516SJR0_9NEIS|nr:hypothetical protein [Chitinimonas arctica]QDQ28288.1 hypothetical protein FNU76_19105 [Chitinimonas arctica]